MGPDTSPLIFVVGFVLSLIVLIVYFCMAHWISTIREDAKKQTKLLMLILSKLQGESILGSSGTAQVWMNSSNPAGEVIVSGEKWDCIGKGEIDSGQKVVVTGVKGSLLIVEGSKN